MRQFILGALVGASLVASMGFAGTLYDRSGNPSGLKGSLQQFDYSRQRQQQLDVGAMRRSMDQDRASGRVPCLK